MSDPNDDILDESDAETKSMLVEETSFKSHPPVESDRLPWGPLLPLLVLCAAEQMNGDAIYS
jgi:hypothetical protein